MNYFWFRRDLRLDDNAGLYHALKNGTTQCIFIFDTSILKHLPADDARVSFIYSQITKLHAELQNLGSSLEVWHGEVTNVWKQILETKQVKSVYANSDYEPQAIMRDKEIEELCTAKGIGFLNFKDQCIFDKNEVTKDDGLPYTVYTPYSKKWKNKLNAFFLKSYPCSAYYFNLKKQQVPINITLVAMGFVASNLAIPSIKTTQGIIKNYEQLRDFPADDATSKLGIHFRFGTISVRQKMHNALQISEKWANELIWREFYMQILYHFPHVVHGAFKPAYNRIEWLNNEQDFENWKHGKTGYPLVDAGMRQLNQTGYMHNRVRMVVASFLTKHLLIDWRWGEAYFAEKLLDFDLASNNGGWQWVAGSGVDAAPYFRVFNPTAQQQKFDKHFKYIQKWVPEFGTPHYPAPIVNHEFARQRCLKTYKLALQ